MTDECISPLRRRMIEDMTVRNFVVKTQTDYIRRVKSFAVFLGRSPDTATREDVRRYLLHLASSGMGAATVNGTGSALRFLFDITLDRPDIVRHLPVAREPRKAPVILSPEEVARMLAAGTWRQVQGGAERGLWGGSAGVRSRCAEGERYRQRADDDPDRAEQAPQGSLRNAVAAAARPAARLVAGLPLAGLVVPGPRSTPADHHASAYPRYQSHSQQSAERVAQDRASQASPQSA